jgi:uncharacterized phage protein gp47/JayE
MIINENGILLDDFDEIFNDFVTKFKDIYGEDIALEQDTQDGQQIGILTNVIYDLQTFIARIYNSLDPDLAEGHELDKILKLIATTRLPATKSKVDVDVTVSKNVELQSTYTIKDENSQEWGLSESVTLEEGTTTLTFIAKEWGAITAQEHTINEQVTVVTEVVSLDNMQSAVVGREEETDEELRRRRNKLVGYNAKSLISSILGKLLDLNGVADAIIYENNTDELDDEKDIQPHSIWAIVDGGELKDIAKTIAIDKTIGCGLKGNVKEIYEEEFETRNGYIRTFHHEINFDRPTKTEIYIKVTVKKRSSSDIIDVDSIKNELSKLNFLISQNITATELYGTIYSAGNTFIASDLQISKDDSIYVDDILIADFDEKFEIVYENIEVTEE